MSNLLYTIGDSLLKSIPVIIPSFISAFVAIKMCRMSKSQNEFIQNSEKTRNTPYLFPDKDECIKHKWIRFCCEGAEADKIIPIKREKDLSDEEAEYVRFCKNNPKSVFLYYIHNDLYLVINGHCNMPGFIIEHHNVEITLINYGAIISKIHVDNIEIEFLDENKIIYEGLDDNYYTDVILTNGTLTIILDEVFDDKNKSFCHINSELYEKLSDSVDIFKTNLCNYLYYKKFTIQLTIWNQNNESSIFDIIIKKSGNQFIREVNQIK